MARPSVVPSILERLEPHLERLEEAWQAQSVSNRRPTLPLTRDRKVNVRQLVLDCGLRQTLEQHFFTKPEVANLVNAVAGAQGVKPIGSRALEDVADDATAKRLAKVGGEVSDLRRALSEREAALQAARAENERLRARLGLLEETGMVLRSGSSG